MTAAALGTLATLIKGERQTILARWRQQVRQLPSAQLLDIPTLNDHIPDLLDELATALESRPEQTIVESLGEDSPQAHGLQRLKDAFDIEEVVAEYNILRGCIHDLATEHGVSLQGLPFHVVNRVFDHAIGLALQTYATQRALEVQARREEYLAFVVHDLRTPLFAISLIGKVLEKSLPSQGYGDEAARLLKSLRRNVLQLEELVRTVLDENTNLQTDLGIKLERRKFDLWPLVEALLDDLQTVAQTTRTQVRNLVPDDLVLFADASALRRVFQNLIANALRYAPGGEVVAAARELETQGVVECWVSDNGAGIPAELLEKIFEKGETDPETSAGTGLGLAIVKTFIEAHGGTVSAESTPGVGSTFRFSLPTKPQSR